MRILVAEDEDFSREMLQGHIERLGHEVVAASDGAEAWSLFQTDEFPLVITDWMMPKLDGLELVRLIRSRKNSAYIYIILLTAKSEKRDVVQGIMEGADDFLTKPYDRDELKVRVRAGERIIHLEESLATRNAELAKANAQLELANRRMKGDLQAAAKIQKSLLPSNTPENAAVDFAWIFRPCDELAGDIFNVFKLDQRHVGFYLLDVVGHGVRAALLSVTLSRFLSPSSGGSSVLFSSERSGHRLLSPSELAAELNRRFPMGGHHGQFFTLLYGCLNVETKELVYVSAGHPGPVYVPLDGSPRVLRVEGFPIGVIDEPGYEDKRLLLRPGDRIFLYSDGLLDAENPNGESFGRERLITSVTERHQSLQQTVGVLEENVSNWCDERWPNDDISVLAMAILPNSQVPARS